MKLHFSVFMGSKKRHGGTKRSEQLVETCSELNIESINPIVSLKQAISLSLKNPLTFIETLFFSLFLFSFRGLKFKYSIAFALRAVYPVLLLKQHKPQLVLHETAPGFSLVFMQYLKWKKINYIAIPHNIEFLVPGQIPSGFRSLSKAFSCEIDGYRSASGVKVICDYDKSILSCLGINSDVFTYYPINSELVKFTTIKSTRKNSKISNSYLALGTVGNKPTFDGVKSLIEICTTNNSSFELIVAGYGTEVFKDYEGKSIRVLGSLEDGRLEELLCKAKVLLINQPQTTGFLTKIVEFNLCGIPIFVLSDYLQAKHLEEYGINCISICDINNFLPISPVNFFSKPSNSILISHSKKTLLKRL